MYFEFVKTAIRRNFGRDSKSLHKRFRRRSFIGTITIGCAWFSMQLWMSNLLCGRWFIGLLLLACAFLLIHLIVSLNTRSLVSQIKQTLQGEAQAGLPIVVQSLIPAAKWNIELQILVYGYLLDSAPSVRTATVSRLGESEAELLSTLIGVGDARRIRLLTFLDDSNPGAAASYSGGLLRTALSFEAWSAAAIHIARTLVQTRSEYNERDDQDMRFGAPRRGVRSLEVLLQWAIRVCGPATFALIPLFTYAAFLLPALCGLHISAAVFACSCDIAALSCWYTWRHVIPMLVPRRTGEVEMRIAYDRAVDGWTINRLSLTDLLHIFPVTYWRKCGLYAPTLCSYRPENYIGRYLCMLEIGRRLNNNDHNIQHAFDTTTKGILRAHLTELLVTLKHRPRLLLTADQVQFYVGVMNALRDSHCRGELDLIEKLSKLRCVAPSNRSVCEAASAILAFQRSRLLDGSSLLLQPTQQTEKDLIHIASAEASTDYIVTSAEPGRSLR